MTEKSALDMISEIHTMMEKMNKTISIMDVNLKLLNDKANGTLFPNPSELMGKMTPMQKAIEEDLSSKPQIGLPQISTEVDAVDYAQKENIKVESKVISADKKPLHGVAVIITNSANKVVKNTKTNRAGIWMCHLPPGKYTVKYEQNGKVLQQKNIDVKDGIKELKI